MATGVLFDEFREGQIAGGATAGQAAFQVTTGTHEILLLTATYTLDHNDIFVGDLSNEVSGTGYTRKSFTAPTVVRNTSTGLITVDSSTVDVTWAQNGAGFTNARRAVWDRFITNDAGSPLIETWDFVTDQGIVAGDLVLTFDAAGLFTSPR